MRTPRPWRNNRQIARNAADADVEKAAEGQSHDEQRACEEDLQALLEYVVGNEVWKCRRARLKSAPSLVPLSGAKGGNDDLPQLLQRCPPCLAIVGALLGHRDRID